MNSVAAPAAIARWAAYSSISALTSTPTYANPRRASSAKCGAGPQANSSTRCTGIRENRRMHSEKQSASFRMSRKEKATS